MWRITAPLFLFIGCVFSCPFIAPLLCALLLLLFEWAQAADFAPACLNR
jgi:hypothetical protein